MTSIQFVVLQAHVAVDEGGVQAIHLAAQQGDIASIEHLLVLIENCYECIRPITYITRRLGHQ